MQKKYLKKINPNYVVLFLGMADNPLVYDFLGCKEEEYKGEKINYYPLIEALDNHGRDKKNKF